MSNRLDCLLGSHTSTSSGCECLFPHTHADMEYFQSVNWHLLKFLCTHSSVFLRILYSQWLILKYIVEHIHIVDMHSRVTGRPAGLQSFFNKIIHIWYMVEHLYVVNTKCMVGIYYCYFSLESSPFISIRKGLILSAPKWNIIFLRPFLVFPRMI